MQPVTLSNVPGVFKQPRRKVQAAIKRGNAVKASVKKRGK